MVNSDYDFNEISFEKTVESVIEIIKQKAFKEITLFGFIRIIYIFVTMP
ncbi:MAG: hypothetical protein ACXACB_11340 [Promethearchaeota archaeon]|jgi:hypothetical protein